MKTLRFLSFAMIIAMAFASCGSEKMIINNDSQQQQSSHILYIPCSEYAHDDSLYYRALGIGKNMDFNFCIQAADMNARSIVMKNFSDVKVELSNCSLYNIDLKEYTNQIHLYFTMNNVCQDYLMLDDGCYQGYVVLEVSKIEIKDSIIEELNKISNEYNLGIDFSEEKFIHYLNEMMSIKQE